MHRGLLIILLLLTAGIVGWVIFSDPVAGETEAHGEGFVEDGLGEEAPEMAEAEADLDGQSSREEIAVEAAAKPAESGEVSPELVDSLFGGAPHHLSGQVVADGIGVANATVLVYKFLGGGPRVPKDKPISRTKTDINGQFQITAPGGHVDLVAFASGFGPKDYMTVDSKTDGEVSGLLYEIFPLQELRGEVQSDGAMVAEAKVRIALSDQWERSRAATQPGIGYRSLPQFELQSDANGSFVKNVPIGTYDVKAEHKTLGNGRASDVIPGQEAIVVYLAAPKKKPGESVSGVVLDQAGSPVPGAEVWFSPSGPKTTTGSDGSFQLEGIKKHWMAEPELIAWAVGHAPGSAAFELPNLSNQAVEIILPAALEISGVLLNADGGPIPDGTVHLIGDRIFQNGSSSQPSLLGIFDDPTTKNPLNRASTNSKGEFRFKHLPVGHFDLSYAKENPAWSASRKALAMAEADAGTQNVLLQVGDFQGMEVVFEGIVRHRHSGLPVEGAKINANLLSRMGQGGWSANGVSDTNSDANGRFRMDGLAKGEYYLEANAKGFADNKTMPIVYQPGVTEFEFEMVEERQLDLLILDAKGEPVPKLQLMVKNAKGNGVMIKLGAGGARSPAPTDDHGKISMHGLPGERISVEVMQNWNVVSRQEFDLTLPGPHQAEIQLNLVIPSDPRTVSLSFVDESGSEGMGISTDPDRAMLIKAFDLDGYLVYEVKQWRTGKGWSRQIAEGKISERGSSSLNIPVPRTGARIEVDAFGYQSEAIQVPSTSGDDDDRLELSVTMRAN